MDTTFALFTKLSLLLEKKIYFRRFFAFCIGGLGVFAFAPFFLWPFLGCMSALLYLETYESSLRDTFKIGIAFSFGFYITHLYWVGHSFSVVGLGKFFFLGSIFLPLYFAIFMALPLLFMRLIVSRQASPLTHALIFGLFLNISFWVQAHLPSIATPWGHFGYAMPLTLLQITSIIGIDGLTFFVVFLSLIFFARSHYYNLFFGTVFLIFVGFGYLRLQNEALQTPYNLRLIQPSISQETKWDPGELQKNMQLQGLLSQIEAEKPIQAIIWPEAAVPFFLQDYPEMQKMLSNAAPQGGYLIFGVPRKHEDDIFNSMMVLNSDGLVKGIVDKKHLLPFGEYVPFSWLLKGISKIVWGPKDFSKGTLSPIVNLEGLPPFHTLICFEAVFPEEIIQEERAEWLLNLTNEAWFGESIGPYQHLAMARVRAIEQGIPLVRVANNGISAVIDPYGKFLHRLELNDIGIIDFTLPKAIEKTFYNTYGFFSIYLFLIIGLILMGGWALCLKKNKTH
jgi:apolipoprotein N-acyltransferase